jgi:hypothetical protein
MIGIGLFNHYRGSANAGSTPIVQLQYGADLAAWWHFGSAGSAFQDIDGTLAASNTAQVRRADDRSGHDHTASRASGSLVCTNAAIGASPASVSDGSSHFTTSNLSLALLDKLEIWAVVAADPTPEDPQVLFHYGDPAFSAGSFALEYSDGSIVAVHTTGDEDAQFCGVLAATDSDPHVYRLVLDRTSGTIGGQLKIYQDGVLMTTSVLGDDPVTGHYGDFPFHLFTDAGASAGWIGTVGELLVLRRHSTPSEATALLSQLQADWGL